MTQDVFFQAVRFGFFPLTKREVLRGGSRGCQAAVGLVRHENHMPGPCCLGDVTHGTQLLLALTSSPLQPTSCTPSLLLVLASGRCSGKQAACVPSRPLKLSSVCSLCSDSFSSTCLFLPAPLTFCCHPRKEGDESVKSFQARKGTLQLERGAETHFVTGGPLRDRRARLLLLSFLQQSSL